MKKGSVRFKDLNEIPTGGKKSVVAMFSSYLFIKNNGILDVRIWICPRKEDGKWQLYENNHITF